MKTGGLGIDQQLYFHILRAAHHSGGEKVNRVGGGQNVEGMILFREGLGTAGQQSQGQQNDKSAA